MFSIDVHTDGKLYFRDILLFHFIDYNNFIILSPGSGLKVCTGSALSCCTPEMEETLGSWTSAQFKSAVDKGAAEMVGSFDNKAKKIDGELNQ
jgi:hypothetical protein